MNRGLTLEEAGQVSEYLAQLLRGGSSTGSVVVENININPETGEIEVQVTMSKEVVDRIERQYGGATSEADDEVLEGVWNEIDASESEEVDVEGALFGPNSGAAMGRQLDSLESGISGGALMRAQRLSKL